ncbi:hypothetical protein M9H77_03279 [Catharanthus roseus]|uniref:Uncharacterized protein n=1 Tax=Catharanthus roseus TaxID=4058 RepID=A0ACC0CAU4_CATRO|nr:hypothetical protein M9H77_03279 [Catharanthus roseus]
MMRNKELEVANILIEMANGPPVRDAFKRKISNQAAGGKSSSEPSKILPKSNEAKKISSGEGKSKEKRKLIVIPPKQRPGSTSTGNEVVPADQSSASAELPFGVVEFLSTVRLALIHPLEEGDGSNDYYDNRPLSMGIMGRKSEEELPSLTFNQIMDRVSSDPGDPRVMEINVRLQDLVRGVLKIFASTCVPSPRLGLWNPLVIYNQLVKVWLWVGPVPSHPHFPYTSPDAWGIKKGILDGLVGCFSNWLKETLTPLQQIASLPPPPLSLLPQVLSDDRFRETRNFKGSAPGISPSCDEVRAYFRIEESLRYSVPDLAFRYTARDGRKSTVVPLKRALKKAREHSILKPDRPSSFTILCLVRDAAARLPYSSGSSADICTLVRDSQFLKEDAEDVEVKKVVSGALDRLQDERDPCITFRRNICLWNYLHADKEGEDFDEDCSAPAEKRLRSQRS